MHGTLNTCVDAWASSHPTIPTFRITESGFWHRDSDFFTVLTAYQNSGHTANGPTTSCGFSPGYRDRIKFTRSQHRGHPRRYWLDLKLEYTLPILQNYIDHTAVDPTEHRKDLLGLKQIIHTTHKFRLHLESVPTRTRACLKKHSPKLSCAWQP